MNGGYSVNLVLLVEALFLVMYEKKRMNKMFLKNPTASCKHGRLVS